MLADSYETTWHDGRKVTIEPTGKVTDTEGNTNKPTNFLGIGFIGALIIGAYLVIKK